MLNIISFDATGLFAVVEVPVNKLKDINSILGEKIKQKREVNQDRESTVFLKKKRVLCHSKKLSPTYWSEEDINKIKELTAKNYTVKEICRDSFLRTRHGGGVYMVVKAYQEVGTSRNIYLKRLTDVTQDLVKRIKFGDQVGHQVGHSGVFAATPAINRSSSPFNFSER